MRRALSFVILLSLVAPRAFAQAPDTVTAIDLPSNFENVLLPFEIGGWAIDRAAMTDSGIDAVHVYAGHPGSPDNTDPPVFLGAAPLGFARPDIGAAFGAQFDHAGWLMRIEALPPGVYVITAFPHSAITHSFGRAVTRFVIVQPLMLAFDTPVNLTTVPSATPIYVGGWAFDVKAEQGVGVDAVHVWLLQRNPNTGGYQPLRFAGEATLGISRPDVGARFGARFEPSGYELWVDGLPPGDYAIAVFAHSSVSNQFDSGLTHFVSVR